MEYKLHTPLSKRFITGLEKRGLEYKDIQDNYYYIGGEAGDHLIYFKQHFPDQKLPPHQDVCICGHRMLTNCFITNGEIVLAMGENCIKKWIKQKSCGDCGARHRNRKDNLCHSCRNRFSRVYETVTLSFS
jgi:hypothetical protein